MHKFLFYIIAFMPKSLRKMSIDKLARYFLNKYAIIHVEGIENIPQDGNVIFISNHLSNADGLIFKYLLEKIKDVTFVAGVKLKGELLTNLVLELVPHINIQPNKPDRKAIRETINQVKHTGSIFIFPEGTRSRSAQLLKGRSGVVLIAKNSNAPIIPIGIRGTEKLLPVNSDGRMSKEWFNQSNVYIKIGEPFLLEQLEGEAELIDLMMEKIAHLLPKEYRGYYTEFPFKKDREK
ncbi:MAG: lysophospholipid acyltransferase family protein [Peptococcaceae bacterium]